MKTLTRRCTALLTMVLAVCFCLVLVNGQKAMAATTSCDLPMENQDTAYEDVTFANESDVVEYKLTTGSAHCYSELTIERKGDYVIFEVFDQDYQLLYSDSISSNKTVNFKFNTVSTYYVRFSPRDENCGGYRFWVKQTPDEADDKTTAEAVSLDTIVEGYLCGDCYGKNCNDKERDADYYKIKTGAYQRKYSFKVWAIDQDQSIDACIINKEGTVVCHMDNAKLEAEVATVTLKANSTYYVKLKGKYVGDFSYGFKLTTGSIVKKAQSVTISPLKKTIYYSKLKRASQKFTLKAAAKTKVTFKKVSGNTKIKVSSGGTVTMTKGMKKGTYSLKVKATAASSTIYKSAYKTSTIKISVR